MSDELIECKAAHNRDCFAYDNSGGVVHIGTVCELCNGTGWVFKSKVIEKLTWKDEKKLRCPYIDRNCEKGIK